LSSKGALLVQYTPYQPVLFVELHETSYYFITSLILLNFYTQKSCSMPFPPEKIQGYETTFSFFYGILPKEARGHPFTFMKPGQKNLVLLKFSLFFFTKYTIIRCTIYLSFFLLFPASL
jgi:hypothetical protein